jgi:hypothetical protein
MTTQVAASGVVITEETTLAALDRAARHRYQYDGLMPLREILSHLDIPSRSAGVRPVRNHLATLVEAGQVEVSKVRSTVRWSITPAGLQRLQGINAPLPESPQHREWRIAREIAGQEVHRLRAALADSVLAATRALNEDVSSNRWFSLSEELQRTAWQFASTTYCLEEWEEPDDAVNASVDQNEEPSDAGLPIKERRRLESVRSERREIRLWLRWEAMESGGPVPYDTADFASVD